MTANSVSNNHKVAYLLNVHKNKEKEKAQHQQQQQQRKRAHTHTGKKSTNKLRYSGGGSLDGTSSERRLASDRVAPVINYLYNWPIVDDDVDDDGDKLVAALTLSLSFFLSLFILWRPFFFLFLSLQQQQRLLLLLRCAT